VKQTEKAPNKAISIIDPHLHLFDLSKGKYQWLKPEKPPFWPDKALIHKSFSIDDIILNEGIELRGFVHVEAGFNNQEPWEELTYLTQTNSVNTQHHLPMRTIAGIELTLAPAIFLSKLKTCLTFPSFAGIRHILDENALAILSHANTLVNIETLQQKELIFEVQMPFQNKTHLSLIKLAGIIKKHPKLSFVINHAGMPPKENNTDKNTHTNENVKDLEQWQQSLEVISNFNNVSIKFSGAEMIDRNYQQVWLNQALTKCLEIFGSQRVMLASNFPLCLFSKSSYQTYWLNLLSLPSFIGLSYKQKKALCYDNAFKFYGFKS
jgi:predicted TIM-barrel fold metal-dependent hydrolase